MRYKKIDTFVDNFFDKIIKLIVVLLFVEIVVNMLFVVDFFQATHSYRKSINLTHDMILDSEKF